MPSTFFTSLVGGDPFYARFTHSLHMFGGIVITLLGCFQLMAPLRKKFPQVHRWMGRAYVTGVVLTFLGGEMFIFGDRIYKIPVASALGFAAAGLLMVICAGFAVYYARKKNFVLHREWAIRTYAFGVCSWTLRIWIAFFFMIGVPYDNDQPTAKNVSSWLFWMFSWGVAEIYIQMDKRAKIPWEKKWLYVLFIITVWILLIVGISFAVTAIFILMVGALTRE